MPLYIMVDENSEVSLSLENVDNYESRKGTHFTLKWSYFTIWRALLMWPTKFYYLNAFIYHGL